MKFPVALIRWSPALTVSLMVMSSGVASAQDTRPGPFEGALVGEWEGEGVYEGNRLSLTRSWTVELGGHLLKADMRVAMPNGASFGALTYWKAEAAVERSKLLENGGAHSEEPHG
jgi:hypothetical protein